jgi:hypothetical protein
LKTKSVVPLQFLGSVRKAQAKLADFVDVHFRVSLRHITNP